MFSQLPNGMTAMEVTAKTTAIIGAATYSGLYTCGGVKSSLKRNFTPSAAGCNSPNGPTRVGPQRFCMCPTTLRSSQTVYATAVSSTPRTIADLITDARINSQIGNATPCFLSCSGKPRQESSLPQLPQV